jgi:tetratricopeptide (TPR) repeat protein
MSKHSLLVLALLAALGLGSAQAQVRAEIGKPLQQAGELLRAGKAREALAEVRKADAVANKTPAEQLTIDRMKAAAAQRAGDTATAIAALEAIHEKAGGTEKGQVAEQLASAYAQARNNAKATEWLNRGIAAGNNSASVRQLQQYLQSAGGDYAAIAKDAAAAVAAAEQAGRRPEEGELLRLADAQQRLGNTSAYITALEKLLAFYPKKDYWNAYLGRLQRKPGFADRFAIDVLRLKLASGTLSKTEDYMEYAQLALQAGLPAEGLRVVEQGFKAGALGTGAEAARHQRLRDLATRNLADAKAGIAAQASSAAAEKAGDDAVKVGYAMVSMGDADAGIKLIEQGIAKGGLKRPEDAKLRLGMALLQQGKSRERAVRTLRSVTGTDGAADIARLWTVVGS